MSNNDKILPPVAQRLKLFRDTIRISLGGLYQITGISNATLSRMERGINSYSSKNVEILAEAFGVAELDFRNEKVPVPKRNKLIQSLKAYLQKHNKDVNLDALLEGSHTSHFLDLYIIQGSLDTYQSVGEIRLGIKTEFDVELKGPDLSNLLKKRKEQGKVKTIKGEKLNTYKYKKTETERKKKG